jgi:hypothetical protein
MQLVEWIDALIFAVVAVTLINIYPFSELQNTNTIHGRNHAGGRSPLC